MPCETSRKPNQSLDQRKAEIRTAITALSAALAAGRARTVIDRTTGAVAFAGIPDLQDARVTDACAYRLIMATGNALARQAIAKAEALAGPHGEPPSTRPGHPRARGRQRAPCTGTTGTDRPHWQPGFASRAACGDGPRNGGNHGQQDLRRLLPDRLQLRRPRARGGRRLQAPRVPALHDAGTGVPARLPGMGTGRDRGRRTTLQARAGEAYQVTTCGQTVLLGSVAAARRKLGFRHPRGSMTYLGQSTCC